MGNTPPGKPPKPPGKPPKPPKPQPDDCQAKTGTAEQQDPHRGS